MPDREDGGASACAEDSPAAAAATEGAPPAGSSGRGEGDPRPAPHFTRDFEETPEGNFIWHASLVLLHYLQAPERARGIRGKRVLELGSGLGHLGHGLARLGAHVTCTDQAKCLPVLEGSLRELDGQHGTAEAAGGSIRIVELNWGQEGFEGSELAAPDGKPKDRFDIVIAAELVYLEETHDLLLWCWSTFCSMETTIYSVFVNRPFSWNFFAKLHDLDEFEVVQIEEGRDFDPCGMEEVHMHSVTRKRA